MNSLKPGTHYTRVHGPW